MARPAKIHRIYDDSYSMLVSSFQRSLLAQNKSPQTIKTYLAGIKLLENISQHRIFFR